MTCNLSLYEALRIEQEKNEKLRETLLWIDEYPPGLDFGLTLPAAYRQGFLSCQEAARRVLEETR